MRRRAGILVPLFSIPSSRSWGIGEIGDLPALSRWLAGAGLRLLQLLPINEVPPGDASPYSALSSMAIDPQFITLDRVEDFVALGGEAHLEPELRGRLGHVRGSATIDYAEVRALKQTALRRAFARFRDVELAAGTPRAAAFRAYAADQAWWLEDYALFRALHAKYGERPWTEWPAPVRTCEPEALARARVELADDLLYRRYLQWIADTQWAEARVACAGLAVFGDLPFLVSGDSADLWIRQDEFRFDASVGVPPDAFSPTGQDWGFPVYRWDVVAERGFDWLRDRARRHAALFDGYRIDHLVGFYRTYYRPHDGTPPAFTPETEEAQRTLGEQVLGVLGASGAEVIAEDLGVVPDFVRESLARLDVPGFKVLRWEREWEQPGEPFRDPVHYPRVAVATSGTHDTEPMEAWWEWAEPDERDALLAVPSIQERLDDSDRSAAAGAAGMTPRLREAVLETLYASGADLLILPVQDIFGWRDRINQPATVSPANWTWRLRWPVDRWTTEPQAVATAAQLRQWATRHGR